MQTNKRAYCNTEEQCRAVGVTFQPLVFDSQGGGWDDATQHLLAKAVKGIEARGLSQDSVGGKSVSSVVTQRISISLQRELARATLRRAAGLDMSGDAALEGADANHVIHLPIGHVIPPPLSGGTFTSISWLHRANASKIQGAGAWLNAIPARPSPQMESDLFRTAVSRRFRIRFHPRGEARACTQCGEPRLLRRPCRILPLRGRREHQTSPGQRHTSRHLGRGRPVPPQKEKAGLLSAKELAESGMAPGEEDNPPPNPRREGEGIQARAKTDDRPTSGLKARKQKQQLIMEPETKAQPMTSRSPPP